MLFGSVESLVTHLGLSVAPDVRAASTDPPVVGIPGWGRRCAAPPHTKVIGPRSGCETMLAHFAPFFPIEVVGRPLAGECQPAILTHILAAAEKERPKDHYAVRHRPDSSEAPDSAFCRPMCQETTPSRKTDTYRELLRGTRYEERSSGFQGVETVTPLVTSRGPTGGAWWFWRRHGSTVGKDRFP
jgi:hypothetical protein